MGKLVLKGRHQVACIDSTDKSSVERLIGEELADMVFADAPYGLFYGDKNRFLNTIAPANRIQEPIQGDHESLGDMSKLWDGFLATTADSCTDKASYYVCSPQGGELMMMMMCIDRSKWTLKHTIIWAKNNHVLVDAITITSMSQFFTDGRRKEIHEFFGLGRCKTSVWDFDKPLKNDLHPTMKPVAIVEEALANSCPAGGSVIDIFLGSGTTLIAAEQTRRRCFGAEIAPEYTDVIIERYIKFCGKRVVKDTGEEWVS